MKLVLIRRIFQTVSIFALLLFLITFRVNAQPAPPPNFQCIGSGLHVYTLSVLNALGEIDGDGVYNDNVRLLTPAFNMTNAYMDGLVTAFRAGDATFFNQFYAVAGNAYNMPDGSGGRATIASWIARTRALIPEQPKVLVTETGWYPPNQTALVETANDIANVAGDSNVIHMLWFNVFGNNGDPNFAGHVPGPGQLAVICGGNDTNCAAARKLGANAAVPSYVGDDFWADMAGHGMTHGLVIARGDVASARDDTFRDVDDALDRNQTPVLRLGVGADGAGFEDPSVLAAFIQELSARVGNRGIAYIIVGPNEPLTECWATPNCFTNGCETSSSAVDVPIEFFGEVRTSMTTYNSNGDPVSNHPVLGAVLALYEGTVIYDSGNAFGLLNKYPGSDVTTDGNGKYRTVGVRRANGGSHDNSMWMYIFCGDALVDQWRLDLTLTEREKNFSVPCPSNEYLTPKRPPNVVALNGMAEQLSCDVERAPYPKSSYSPREIGPGMTIRIKLLREDVDDTWIDNAVVLNPTTVAAGTTGLPPTQIYPPSDELLARSDISRTSGTYDVTYTALMGNYVYDEESPQKDGQEPEDTLPLCDDIKFASRTTSEDLDVDVQQRNTHQSFGIGATLSSPVMWEYFYAALADKEQPVCYIDNNTNLVWDEGEEINLCQIAPPHGFNSALRRNCSGGDTFDLDSSYFPYLSLLGLFNNTIAMTDNSHRATVDSFVEQNSEDRDTPYDNSVPTFEDAFQVTSSSLSTESLGNAAFDEQAQQCVDNYCGDLYPFADNKGIGGVMGTPHDAYGCENSDPNNPDLGCVTSLDIAPNVADNVVKWGIGDYQLRPFELCTCNTDDFTCAPEDERFNDFSFHETDEEDRWTDGTRYLSDQVSHYTILGFDFELLFGVFFNLLKLEVLLAPPLGNNYIIEYLPIDQFWGQIDSATEANIACYGSACPNGSTGSCSGTGCPDPDGAFYYLPQGSRMCVEMGSRTVDWDCTEYGNAFGFTCNEGPCNFLGCTFCTDPLDPTTCTTADQSCGSVGCSQTEVCDGPMSQDCQIGAAYAGCNIFNTRCEYIISDQPQAFGTGVYAGNPACKGDLRAEYAATNISFEDGRFDRAGQAVMMQTKLLLGDPFVQYDSEGCGATTDHPNTAEETFMAQTSAFNTVGACGGENANGVVQVRIADPDGTSFVQAPDFSGQMPDAGFDPNNGSGIAGNGQAGAALGNCPDPNYQLLPPPWDSTRPFNPAFSTPLPRTGSATRYGIGLFEQVYQNRLTWGDVVPCVEQIGQECVGLVALLRPGDINKLVCATVPKADGSGSTTYGPYLVADTATSFDAPRLECTGWTVDVDYESFCYEWAAENGWNCNAPIDDVTIYEWSDGC